MRHLNQSSPESVQSSKHWIRFISFERFVLLLLNGFQRCELSVVGKIFGLMPAPSLVLCADIRHTLGASEYAYLSFLAIASRARRRLGMFGAVVVLLPRSLGGLRMDLLVTRDSLEAYGRGAGLTLLLDSDAGAAGHSCDHSNNDIRVTDKVRTHSSLLLPISPPQYNMTSRPPLDTFLDGVWSYIDAAAIARGRRTGSLRVSLSLVQASMGPLAHAASLLHTEALDIVRALAIAAPPQSLRLHPAHSPSSATPPSSCAYVFLGLFLGTGLIDLSTARELPPSLNSLPLSASPVANALRSHRTACCHRSSHAGLPAARSRGGAAGTLSGARLCDRQQRLHLGRIRAASEDPLC